MKRIMSRVGLIFFAALLSLGMTVAVAVAQQVTYNQARFPRSAGGYWSLAGTGVVGNADGVCSNMGANGKVNVVYDFGFNLPNDASITGVTARVKTETTKSGGQDVTVNLITNPDSPTFASPTTIGSDITLHVNQVSPGNCAQVSWYQIGGPISSWGSPSLTAAIVNSSNFGALLETTDTVQLKVDSVCIQVAYTTDTGSATQESCGSPETDLEITKDDGQSIVTHGELLTYSVVVTNNGWSAANGAVVTDPTASGLTKTGTPTCGTATGGAVCPSAGNITNTLLEGSGVTIPWLPLGGSLTFTIYADVAATSGSVTNSATVAVPAGVSDSNSSNNTDSDTDSVTGASPSPSPSPSASPSASPSPSPSASPSASVSPSPSPDPRTQLLSVPTMTDWGMIFFVFLAGIVSIFYLRKRKKNI